MDERNVAVVYSVSLCRYTCAKAVWDQEQEQWICSEHQTSDCVNTFRNVSLLHELTEDPDSHPDWPSAEELDEQRRLNESFRVHHTLTYWIQQKLTADQWDELNDRCDEIFDQMGIEYVGSGGPLPE